MITIKAAKNRRIVEEEEPTNYDLKGKTSIYTRRGGLLDDLPVNTDGSAPLVIAFEGDECWIAEGPGLKDGDAGFMVSLSTKSLLKAIREASDGGYIPPEWLRESRKRRA